MLRTNLFTEGGLVNGSIGIVENIKFKMPDQPPNNPSIIMVKFLNNKNFPDPIPIPTITRIFTLHGQICRRTQFPLMLSWAITIHKSQGLTLEKAVIDIGPKEFSTGLTYVAFSRVRKLKDIILLNGYTLERLNSHQLRKLVIDRKIEELRLKNI